MNFTKGTKVRLKNQDAHIAYADVDSVLLKFDAGNKQLYPLHDLLIAWDCGDLNAYDEKGHLRDPEGLSERENELVDRRLPYALHFMARSDIDRHVAIRDIAARHGHQDRLPGVSTCYRWASRFKEFGRAGLANKRRT